MAPNENTIIAFDLYGTLLSTESIAKELAKHFGEEKAATVAATWRKYQLEYTWRLNSMSVYTRFRIMKPSRWILESKLENRLSH